MKILILLLSLFAIVYCNAQELATTDTGKRVSLSKNGTYKYIPEKKLSGRILLNDFKHDEGKVFYPENLINLEDADKKQIHVRFSFISSEEQFQELTETKLNLMVFKANLEVMYSMKNKFTYTPKKIVMIHNDTDKWVLSITYTAQNDYGALKDGNVMVSMTGDGFVYRID